MEPWFSEAKAIPFLEAEVGFLIRPSFYYGPDGVPDIREGRLVEALSPPDIPLVAPSMVRSSEAAGKEKELAAYYEQVIRCGWKHQKQFSQYHQYFWIRFWLWNSQEDVHISFPWYDTMGEVESFLEELATTEAGEVFWDRDQSWELNVYAHEGDLYIREHDPDAEETYCIVRVPRSDLLARVEEVRARSKQVIRNLTEILGADVWTSRVSTPSFRASLLQSKKRGWRLW